MRQGRGSGSGEPLHESAVSGIIAEESCISDRRVIELIDERFDAVTELLWPGEPVSAAVSLTALWLGAKLGAIRGGFKWTAADAVGLGTRHRQAGWTLVDTRGHALEIYGSGG